jgi:hypothetical protein
MVSRERVFGQRELKAPPLYVSLCTPSRARKSLASSAPFRANVDFRAQPMRATRVKLIPLGACLPAGPITLDRQRTSGKPRPRRVHFL